MELYNRTEEYLQEGNTNDVVQNEFGKTFLGKVNNIKATIKDLDKDSLESCFSDSYQAISTCGDDTFSKPVEDIVSNIQSYFDSTIKGAKTHLVIGCRGVGKSTLISYITRIALSKNKDDERILYLKVDMQNSPSKEHLIEERILTKIEDSLQNMVDSKIIPDIYTDISILRVIFHNKIRALVAQNPDDISDELLLELMRTSISQDQRSCTLLRLKFVANHNKLCVIFDNVDHVESIETEKNIFKQGKSLIQGINCKYIISLRRPTYSTHHDTLTLDLPNVTIINPPLIEDILKKKITYLVKKGDISPTLRDGVVKIDTSTFSKTAFYLFNAEVFKSLNLLCNGNIRDILEHFIEMLCSGHISNTQFYKAVRTYASERNIINEESLEGANISLQACLFGLGVPRNMLYVENNLSLLINMHDNGMPTDKFNNIIRYRVLSAIKSATYKSDSKGYNGGLQYLDLVNRFEDAGYNKEAVKNAISALCDFQLIRTGTFRPLKNKEKLVITYSGHYYFKKLMLMSRYMQILHSSSWLPEDRCANLNEEHNLKQRFSQIKLFVDHIEDVENHEIKVLNPDFVRENILNNLLHLKLSNFHTREFESINRSRTNV